MTNVQCSLYITILKTMHLLGKFIVQEFILHLLVINLKKISNIYNVCLATQSSLERLYSLVEVTDHWKASVSVSVFIGGSDFPLLKSYISYLRHCFPRIRDYVTFHLAFSPDHPPIEDDFTFILNQNCANLKKCSKNWCNTELKRLRNGKRKFYIDIIPSYGITERLDEFLETVQCEKLCAYVIPVYEIDDKVIFPEDKSMLVNYTKHGLARPFHDKIYKLAQASTDYKRWEENDDHENDFIYVSHTAKYKDTYEPFFVVLDTAPLYDERFIGYGCTRNTQAYEMNAAGYEFQVLSPVFACHWHFQTLKEDYYPWRNKQLRVNYKKVSQFKSEIKARYPTEKNKETKPKEEK
ncbi:hypothetical protein L9F63_000814, partial [Diploptera punctata]